jgi:hypothetical protein
MGCQEGVGLAAFFDLFVLYKSKQQAVKLKDQIKGDASLIYLAV